MSLDLLPIHKLNKRLADKEVEGRSGDVVNGNSILPLRWHQHMFGGVVGVAGGGVFLCRHLRRFEGQVDDQLCRATEAKDQSKPSETELSKGEHTTHGISIETARRVVNREPTPGTAKAAATAAPQFGSLLPATAQNGLPARPQARKYRRRTLAVRRG